MPSYYSVVQFVPDPIADERINIGVIAFGDDKSIECRFLRGWARVQCFSRREIGFLRDFARSMTKASQQLSFAMPGAAPRLDAEAICHMAGHWMNTIQLTEPRPSIRPVAELIKEISKLFLVEPSPLQHKARGRQDAAILVAQSVRRGLDISLGADRTEHLFKEMGTVWGELESHKFDAVAGNGTVLLAAKGLSFEVEDTNHVIDEAVYSIADVNNRKDKEPPVLAVGYLPPSRKSKDFDRATKVFGKLKVPLIPMDQLGNWVSAQKIIH